MSTRGVFQFLAQLVCGIISFAGMLFFSGGKLNTGSLLRSNSWRIMVQSWHLGCIVRKVPVCRRVGCFSSWHNLYVASSPLLACYFSLVASSIQAVCYVPTPGVSWCSLGIWGVLFARFQYVDAWGVSVPGTTCMWRHLLCWHVIFLWWQAQYRQSATFQLLAYHGAVLAFGVYCSQGSSMSMRGVFQFLAQLVCGVIS